MTEFIKLNSLIGEIYDASIDADLWHDVVKSIAEFVPGAFVNVFSQDATKKSAQRSAAFCRCRSSAACTIITSGSNFRHGQRAKPDIRSNDVELITITSAPYYR